MNTEQALEVSGRTFWILRTGPIVALTIMGSVLLHLGYVGAKAANNRWALAKLGMEICDLGPPPGVARTCAQETDPLDRDGICKYGVNQVADWYAPIYHQCQPLWAEKDILTLIERRYGR